MFQTNTTATLTTTVWGGPRRWRITTDCWADTHQPATTSFTIGLVFPVLVADLADCSETERIKQSLFFGRQLNNDLFVFFGLDSGSCASSAHNLTTFTGVHLQVVDRH